MGMQLSDELRVILEILGFDWPSTDEDRVAAWAEDWRALGGGDSKVDLRGAVKSLAARNEGDGISSFVAHIHESDSVMNRYDDLFQGCEALATTCLAISKLVLLLKIAVIAHLSTCAFSLVIAVASGGTGAAAAAAAKAAAKRAIGMLLEEAVNSLLAE